MNITHIKLNILPDEITRDNKQVFEIIGGTLSEEIKGNKFVLISVDEWEKADPKNYIVTAC